MATLTPTFPKRKAGERYVIVVYKPTGLAFSLDGHYVLLEEECRDQDVEMARHYNIESWDGWLPTIKSQLPEWAIGADKEDFIAYWVAD